MRTLRPIALAGALCLCVSAGVGPVAAQDDDSPPGEEERQPDALLDGLADQLLSMLRGMLQAIPQYEMPEINEDGDIIIRRKRPEPEREELAADAEAVET